MTGSDGLKSLGLLHNGLSDATGGKLCEDRATGRSDCGAFGAFAEVGVVMCDDEAPCD